MGGIRVRVVALRNGGLASGPYIPDATTRHRFPPAVCLRASVLGLPVGEMTIANGDHVGHVIDLSVRSHCPQRPVARRLLREAEELGRQAGWTHLTWQLAAGDAGKRLLATWLAFRPAHPSSQTRPDDRLLARPLDPARTGH